MQKYDTEMGAINDEMTALAEQYMAEKAKMRRLENHFEGFRLSEGADFASEMMQMANELEVTKFPSAPRPPLTLFASRLCQFE